MANLETTYMGIPLDNPIIAGASTLTEHMKTVKEIEAAGAGALITKSLFEEQIQLEQLQFDEDLHKYDNLHAEMTTIMPELQHAGPEEHLMWVRKTKESVGIPVIGSLNAVNRDTWLEYAKLLEETGVDGLECNFFASPKDPDREGAAIEQEQVDIVAELKNTVSIPVSIKLSTFYSNPLNVIHRMDAAGATAVVLFNRLFEPDIDTGKEEILSPFNFSHETDYRLPLRYAGLLEGTIDAGICCSTGIYGADAAIKMILAGADTVQIVSALCAHGASHIRTMLSDMEQWMNSKNYKSLSDFRGKLSRRHLSDPWAYTRAQYARLLMNPGESIKSSLVA